MRLLQWAHVGMRTLDAIEVACEIERFVFRPGELHQFQIFRSPPVALVLGAEIAVAMLLVIRLAGDDVNREPATCEMIERCDLACQQGRGNEAGPVCDEIAEPLRPHRRIERDQKTFRRRGRIAHQHHVESGAIMGAGKFGQIGRRQAALDHMQAGSVTRRRHADHSDNHHGHDRSSREG